MSIIQKIGLIILLTSILIIIIVAVPEGSNFQLLLIFFVGGLLEYFQKESRTKVEVVFNYLLILSFLSVWILVVPNKIQGIFFLMGIYCIKLLKLEIKQFKKEG